VLQINRGESINKSVGNSCQIFLRRQQLELRCRCLRVRGPTAGLEEALRRRYSKIKTSMQNAEWISQQEDHLKHGKGRVGSVKGEVPVKCTHDEGS